MTKPALIGFVATGDEVVNGDILNTNCQRFCQSLIAQGMIPGQQVVVGDNQADITAAINYLRATHRAVITIGGLGPTSDDVTRQSLAAALGLELTVFPETWQWIVDKLQSLGYIAVPETNRQQTWFPIGATPLRNQHGTAAGCHFAYQGQDFFMLPGPPNECLPLFSEEVLPRLQRAGYASQLQRKNWLLLGVSEGDMAGKLQPIAANYPSVTLGFRVHYPYLEIKLVSDDLAALSTLSQQFEQLFGNLVVSDCQQTATQQLLAWILNTKSTVTIKDTATHGALLQRLLTPATAKQLLAPTAALQIELSGLDHYWQGDSSNTEDTLALTLQDHRGAERFTITVPLRGERTLLSACERTAWSLLQHLRTA